MWLKLTPHVNIVCVHQCHGIFCKFRYAQPQAMTEWANIMTFRQALLLLLLLLLLLFCFLASFAREGKKIVGDKEGYWGERA